MNKERKNVTTALSVCLISVAGWLAACTNDEMSEPVQTFDEQLGLYVVDDGAITYNAANSRAPMTDNEKLIGKALGECASEMLYDYSSDSPSANTILSPMTASMLYSMMSNFTDNKATDDQNVYKKYLGLANYQNDDINSYHRKFSTQYEGNSNSENFSIKGDMWLQKNSTIYQSFASIANSYHVGVEGIDFNSASDKNKMNSTVQEHVGNTDMDYLPSDYNGISSAITASVSFNQKWENEFVGSKDYTFYNSDSTSTTCKALSFNRQAGFVHFDTFDMVEIPYQERRFIMYVLLPHENVSIAACLDQVQRKGLANCVAMASDAGRSFHYEGIINSIDTLISDTIVKLTMPALKLQATTALNKRSVSNTIIRQLYQTNLAKVSPNGFTLNNIFQTCDIELNEKGTQASAKGTAEVIAKPDSKEGVIFATKTQFSKSELILTPVDTPRKGKRIQETVIESFAFNHPFALFIRETATGGVPFAAIVNTMNN